MKCPVCASELTELTVAGVVLDACDGGCGGVWLDNFELIKLINEDGAVAEVAGRIRPKLEGYFDYSKRHDCPRCDGEVVMQRHFFSRNKSVEVDTCPNCNGRWLDAHELARIARELGKDPT